MMLVRSDAVQGKSPGLSPVAVFYEHAGLTFAADNPVEHDRADVVLGVGPSGLAVANLTVRRPAGWALDLGCGCGLQAMLLAAHCRHVLALDLNPRAAAYTKSNARLNGIHNVHVVRGDLFQSLRPGAFDLIACNPPYVISPDQDFLYRDGGMDDGGLTKEIVRQVPRYLKQGGYATIIADWPVRAAGGWTRELWAWLEGSGCDLWLAVWGISHLEDYARRWLNDAQQIGVDALESGIKRWAAWYGGQGIKGIASGILLLRKRSGVQNWARGAVLTGNPGRPAGEQVMRIFQAHDLLLDQGSLPAGQLKIADDIEFETNKPENGGGQILRLKSPLGYERQLKPPLMQWIPQLRRGVTLMALREQASLQHNPTQVGLAELEEELLQMWGLGFLAEAD